MLSINEKEKNIVVKYLEIYDNYRNTQFEADARAYGDSYARKINDYFSKSLERIRRFNRRYEKWNLGTGYRGIHSIITRGRFDSEKLENEQKIKDIIKPPHKDKLFQTQAKAKARKWYKGLSTETS